jgi:helix-turn-helix, Psq domain
MPHSIMADAFANLSKSERIEKAVEDCARNIRLTARKAGKIYRVAHTTITRRINKLTQSRPASYEFQQLLTSMKKQTVVK